MRVLITGGTGFIGSRLALRCLAQGDSVRVLGQENTPAEAENRNLIQSSGAEVIVASVTEADKVMDAAQGVDIVFHLAAAQHEANVPDRRFWDVNVTGTKNVLDASVATGVKRFVHGSTIGVYGSALNGSLNERSPLRPDNIYGTTKLEGEKLALSYRDKLPLVVVRISETYGPGDRRLLRLFRAIRKGRFFMIGRGDNLHHPIYIEDLVDGILLAANSEDALGGVFVLSGVEPITTRQMVETIAAQLGVETGTLSAPVFPFLVLSTLMAKTLGPLGIQPPLHPRRMDFFRKSFVFSQTDASRVLGFTPKYSFKRGIRETAKWYSQMGYIPLDGHGPGESRLTRHVKLTARMEPFDSFWEGPSNIEKGYKSFHQFYKRNYLKHLPMDKQSSILAVSCGPGYFVNTLNKEGYANVLGIDSDPVKVEHARKRGLNCSVQEAFPFLAKNQEAFDVVFCESEINHLTKEEILEFLRLCKNSLRPGGTLIFHSMNGANPITGAEGLALNFDHYNTFTEYSMRQILRYSEFEDIKVIPLKLYVFYKNPLNYVGIAIDALFTLLFRFAFTFYGKSNKLFSKKIAAIARKPEE